MRFGLRTIAHLCMSLFLVASASACKQPPAKTAGAGDVLRPFIVLDAASGQRYCQICAYGGKPKIVFFADARDASAEADLLRIQRLVDRYRDRDLRAIAVFGEITPSGLGPSADPEKVAAEKKLLRERLGLTFPLAVVPPSYSERESKRYVAFAHSYRIEASRRLFYAVASNRIVLAESLTDATAGDQLAKLEAELAKLGPPDPSQAEAWNGILRRMRLDVIDRDGNVSKESAGLGDVCSTAKPAVIAFWATYCPPCLDEMPMLSELASSGHQVVGVSLDGGNLQEVARVLAEMSPRYPQAVLQEGSLALVGRRLESGLPFTMILDRSGQVHRLFPGKTSKDELASVLAGL
jgi:thiol-disulfide isomerase/thioredoxin